MTPKSILRDHRAAEGIVQADTQDVVAEARVHIRANRGERHEREGAGAESVEIHIEIFELRAPVVGDLAFNTGADRPAEADIGARAERGDRNAVAVETGER